VVRYPITRFSDILNGPKPGMTALMRASGRGDLTEVRRLLSEKADPNAQDASGWTALMYATGARASSIDIVYSLIAAGADPNKKSAMGQTATMAAATALRDRGPVLRQIVGAGGDVQAADRNGQTALMFAATGIYGMQTVTETDSRYADYSDALSFLVTSGARSDAVDINGFTVFHQLDHLTKSSAGRITTYDAIREILSRKP
jgi:ankyrin repeat protein